MWREREGGRRSGAACGRSGRSARPSLRERGWNGRNELRPRRSTVFPSPAVVGRLCVSDQTDQRQQERNRRSCQQPSACPSLTAMGRSQICSSHWC
ncbi:hypothetical protein EYF80_014425 [Liparis tanakae]|uniref:Uncharacterized protein n=1 Tax=Liparis tanakae TaxID=230148 RepID=A0A4Z2IBJ7_9TELE|nr:hypothetical protein EYF80_014425 [Liparis tanakae]